MRISRGEGLSVVSGAVKLSVDVADAADSIGSADAGAQGGAESDASSFEGFVGNVDRCGGRTLDGWAQVPYLPHLAAEVEILIDGSPAGLARANRFREDLRLAAIRDGFAAFRFSIPTHYCDGRPHALMVRERLSQKALGGVSEFCLDAPRDPPGRAEIFLNSVALTDDTRSAHFVQAMASRRRLAILCVFSPDNLLLGQHRRLIEALQAAGFAVLLSQARATESFVERETLAPPPSGADATLIKENLGYDFGTWLASYVAVREHIPKLDELLLINDSVFGPLFDFDVFVKALSARPEDVVGVCDSYEFNYHLQSFFLLIRRNVLNAGVLDRFANTYPYSDDKNDVVRDGELSLTPFLLREGFSCAALFPYEELAKAWLQRLPAYLAEVEALSENAGVVPGGKRCDEVEYLLNLARHIRRGDPVNPAHAFWNSLLDLRCPFIKRDLLFKNPTGNPLLYRVASALEATGYPLGLIRESARHFGTSKVFI